MKIGTWNLDAQWSAAHEAFLRQHACDVWLLTEVSPDLYVPEYCHHTSTKCMARGQRYAAILSRDALTPFPDPHGASAAAIINGITFCSSILPWSACASEPSSPWAGSNSVGEMVHHTIEKLSNRLPSDNHVWGGDWNQNLSGPWQYVGSQAGRVCIEDYLKKRGLQVPTATLPHQRDGAYTIDHIAIPKSWKYVSTERIEASRFSDHDAYTVEVSPSSSAAH